MYSIDYVTFLDHVDVDKLILDGRLDGKDINHILDSAVFNVTNEAKFGRVRFDNVIIDGDLNVTSGIVGGTDIVALNSSAIRLDGNESINEGSFDFTMVSYIVSRNYKHFSLIKFFLTIFTSI